MNPLISIIVPVYKVEAYLDRCVQSIVEQTYQNLDVILVDDGSPDTCPAMCEAWAARDPRISVIHKKNGGQGDARNYGLRAAKGDYIAFMDSDDWIDPDYIEILYQTLTQAKADLSACRFSLVYDTEYKPVAKKRENHYRLYTAEEAVSELIQGKGFSAVIWNKLYKASLLKGDGFDDQHYREDEFFTYRILGKCQRLAFVDESLYNYFQRQGSTMNRLTPRHLDVLIAYRQRLQYLEERFPALLKGDKLSFCTSCTALYADTFDYQQQDSRKMRQIIKENRRQVKFTPAELKRYSLHDLSYILGSAWCISLFSRLFRLRTRR